VMLGRDLERPLAGAGLVAVAAQPAAHRRPRVIWQRGQRQGGHAHDKAK
jgi:hypothetical protein